MNFFVQEEALGGAGCSRRQLRAEIAALFEKLDAEQEKREALLRDLRRTDRAIECVRELLRELEADA